jgi:hypothetical protein
MLGPIPPRFACAPYRPLLMLLPLVFILGFLITERAPSLLDSGNAPPAPAAQSRRLVVVIVDSLRRQAVEELMPNLRALAGAEDAVDLDVTTGAANMSLPCIQTLMEGRQSPFVSGIHNFTGRRGNDNSLPMAAKQAGLDLVIIGDFILDSLYRQHALKSTDITRWRKETPLSRDLRAIELANKSLARPNIRVLLLHLPGTDKVAHKWHPDHPEYNNHFRQVDAKLATLFAELDFRTDCLIVTGDHGHDHIGNHVPRSVAIFRGDAYRELFQAVGRPADFNQVEMLYFMSFAMALPLPVNYEGRYFGFETGDAPSTGEAAIKARLAEFGALQERALTAGGFRADALAGAIQKKRVRLAMTDREDLQAHLPILVWYLVWILVASCTIATWPLLAVAAAAPLVWLASSPASGAPLAIALGAGAMAIAWRFNELRRLVFFGVLVLAAGVNSYFAVHWSHHGGTVGFIAMLVGLGAGLAMIRYGTILAGPETTTAVCLFSLPGGVYAFQFGENVFRAMAIGGILSLIMVWGAHFLKYRKLPVEKFDARFTVSMVALLISGTLLQLQDGNGWGWHSWMREWLRDDAQPACWPIYAAFALYLLWVIRSGRFRGVVGLLLVAIPLYCYVFARLQLPTLVTATTTAVFLAAWLVLLQAGGSHREPFDGHDDRRGLVVVATVCAAFWILFQGYFVQKIDFTFALKYFSEVEPEFLLFGLVYVAAFFKYSLLVALIMIILAALTSPDDLRRLVTSILLFSNVKLLALFTQVFTGALEHREKLYEIAISDTIFVFNMMLIVALYYGAVRLASTCGERLTSRRQRRVCSS